jgi:diguanylate cyclase (GGDEF)-like protein/putative nucleotidyltransferase with HDIG domain
LTVVADELPITNLEAPADPGFPRRAALFLWLVAAVAVAAAGAPIAELGRNTEGWATFAVLATAAAISQLFVARIPQSATRYYTTIVFLVAAVLLLPAGLVALIAVVQHVPEWLKMRYRWYIQTFNILNYTLDCLAAWWAAHLVLGSLHELGAGGRWALAGAVACVVFVATNHVVLAAMLHFADRAPFSRSGLFSLESLATDLILAALGVAVATLWVTNVWLIVAAVAPLVLIHRSLNIPALEEEARLDPKTGLFNARHFAAELRDELARAKRFARPMAVIMADLDLLREVNNSFGHLAGDAVLRGVAAVFRRELRDFDVPARFGGEEFAILLPETTPQYALEIAERIRRRVAATAFDIETSSDPIRVTISCGVAGYPRDGHDVNELVHQADLAVYRAKLQGRNRALAASREPLLVRAERSTRLAPVSDGPEEPLSPPISAAGAPDVERRAADEPRHVAVGSRLLAVFVRPLLRSQNASLERANRLLKERSTAAMETLSATVDARDAYTAGHSRRVQQLSLAIGRELGLSQAELDLLGHAALFHDIGKLAIPDAILLKPTTLSGNEWALMQRHADEGAKIIDRLGFLHDAVPAIRHHHERFDGRGYPDGLRGEEIPLGARIIHLADALDSMVTTRIYRTARPVGDALRELRDGAGTQFCPRCVGAAERLVETDGLNAYGVRMRVLANAS